MADIFVCYRSDDNPYVAASIYELLAKRLGADRVFRDCDSMSSGDNYPVGIRAALARCRLLVAVIGPGWLRADGSGRRRVDDERDWVRQELRFAFHNRVPVLPVLLDGADPPRVGELPDDIRELARTQAHRVRHSHQRKDLSALAKRITTLVPGLNAAEPAATTPATVFKQSNTARDGGMIFANQGGNQIVHNHAPEGSVRP